MNKRWTNGLDSDQIKEIKKHYANADIFRSKMINILQKREKEIYNKSISSSEYESPNWSVKQADSVGFLRALKYVQELIKD